VRNKKCPMSNAAPARVSSIRQAASRHVGNLTPQLWQAHGRFMSPSASAEFVAWAHTLPSDGGAGRAYRGPVFEDSRALSKTDARQLELQDARQAITKVRERVQPRTNVAATTSARAFAQAVLRSGSEGASPAEGDLVLCHISLRTCDDDERLLFTTRLDDGGEGVPLRAALTSEGCALLRGVELALSAFTRGERAVLRIPPEFAYGACHSEVMKIGSASWEGSDLCTFVAARAHILRRQEAVSASRCLSETFCICGCRISGLPHLQGASFSP